MGFAVTGRKGARLSAGDVAAKSITLTPVNDEGAAPITIDDGAITIIGRGATCEARLTHASVSKQHAVLQLDGGQWTLTDLGSLNGTQLNDKTLKPKVPVALKSGDTVCVGVNLFKVHIAGEPTPSSGTGRYVTRATMFPRLRHDDEAIRELGWSEFEERYAPVIVGFARNAGLPMQDADDVRQEVMLGFLRVSDEFEYDPKKGRFRGYLKKSTLNVIRKRLRKPGAGAGIDSDDFADDSAGVSTMWDRHWDEQLMTRAVEEARGRFDERTFEAFELYGQRGVPAEEVARRLEMQVNSVHQAKRRVLQAVGQILERLRSLEG